MVSFVWKYFIKVDKNFAKCKEQNCGKLIKTCKANTTGLKSHLSKIHQIEEGNMELSVSPIEQPTKKQKCLIDLVQFSSLEETISRLICQNNLNYNQIAKSKYLNKSLHRDFPKQYVPKHPTTITNQLGSLKAKGTKFSTTLDEWTSGSRKRYLNINLHYFDDNESKHINLGLIRLFGSCPRTISKIIFFL